jgi:hypothetical protein
LLTLATPRLAGGGAVLAATLADGALTLLDTVHSVDVRPRRARMQRYRAALHTPPPPRGGGSSRGGGGEAVWGLAAAAPAAPLPLLPRAWGLLLRLLLQRGVPEAALRELGTLAASVGQGVLGGRCADAEMALERLEADVSAARCPALPKPPPLYIVCAVFTLDRQATSCCCSSLLVDAIAWASALAGPLQPLPPLPTTATPPRPSTLLPLTDLGAPAPRLPRRLGGPAGAAARGQRASGGARPAAAGGELCGGFRCVFVWEGE